MGLEVIAAIGLGITAASTISQSRARRKAARAQREGNAVNTATGEINNAVARRRAAREARIRRQRLIARSSASGTSGSSGELGANSAINANLGSAIANQQTAEEAARGLSAANQKVADANSSISRIQQFTSLANKTLGIADDAGVFG